MNVEVFGRIRPSLGAGEPDNLVVEGQRLAAHSKGPYLNCKTLHRQNATNRDVFTSLVDLIDYFMAGFNVCVLVMGESDSGKTYTLAGEGSTRAGIVPMCFETLYTRLKGEQYMQDTRVKRENPVVTFQMFEIYNEMILDLLQSPGSHGGYLELGESAEKGTFVKNCSKVTPRDASEAASLFRQGLSRRTEASTDYGPARNNAAICMHIDLQVLVGQNSQPNESRFTICELPGLEKLSDDPNELRQREGVPLSKAVIALNSVVTSLSSYPYPDRVITSYSDSKLTRLLQDELGGNFKTRGVLTLKPSTNPNVLSSILTFCTRLTQVKNYPLVNDSYAKNLLTQYRARILELQQSSGLGPTSQGARMTNAGDVQSAMNALETENIRLKDENERLRKRNEGMHSRFGNLAQNKTDLASDLLLSEEDKLKLSESLVLLEIENIKIREEAEAMKFEHTNKILMLENELMECQRERDKAVQAAKTCKERLKQMEDDRKDLADEYVALKTNFLALKREHEKEVARNGDLSIELLNLVNAKASLKRQIAALTDGEYYDGENDPEIDRVRAMIALNSSDKAKADDILGTQKDRQDVEKTLFYNKRRHEGEMDKVKREHGEEAGRLQKQLAEIQKELQDSRNLARERQHKMAETSAALVMARSDKEALEVQVNRLQHKTKDLADDYKQRLVTYVEDIASYVDSGSGVPGAKRDKRLRQYVQDMMKEVVRSHNDREEQLSQAAQAYREGKRNYARRYEEVLIAYRKLRLMCEERGIDPVDLGPDEHQFKFNDQEIVSNHQKEISRLKTELSSCRDELKKIKTKYGLTGDMNNPESLKPGEKPAHTWAALRKQLREYTLNTQQQLEEERAKLLTENEVMKQQLKESQNYIDIHLARYKQEIVKLRGLLGYDADGGMVLTDRTERGNKGKSRRH